MLQIKDSVSKFYQKSDYVIQFSNFSLETTWFKENNLYLNFLGNAIMLFSSEFTVNMDQTK